MILHSGVIRALLLRAGTGCWTFTSARCSEPDWACEAIGRAQTCWSKVKVRPGLLLTVTNSLTFSKGNTATAWSLDRPKTVTVTGEACTHLLTHEQQQSTHHRRCSLPSQRAFLLHLHVKGVKLCIFLSFFDDKLVLNMRSAEPGPGNAEHSDGTRCPCFSLSWCEVRSHTHFALLSSNDPDSANYRAGPSFIPSGHDRGRLAPGADVEVIVHLFTLNISFTRVQKSIMDMNAPFFCIKVHLDPWSKFNHCDRRFSKEKMKSKDAQTCTAGHEQWQSKRARLDVCTNVKETLLKQPQLNIKPL